MKDRTNSSLRKMTLTVTEDARVALYNRSAELKGKGQPGELQNVSPGKIVSFLVEHFLTDKIVGQIAHDVLGK